MQEEDEIRKAIMLSAAKHPNSRVSKLIRSIETERSQKDIVLLLIELAEHAEYATDFNISLKYYLDLFSQLSNGREIMLNDTGMLLLNSSKIYGRRVDFVHELVERQINTLNNTDKEITQAKNAESNNTEKVKCKRGRKRLVEAPSDPYEIELIPKKFRKISNEKRFAINTNNNATLANKIKLSRIRMRQNEAEQHIHPAGWIHAHIVDLENEEEIDSKRNFKLFTYHVEHRYNTLVSDINFRLHFMVKDYIDAEEERMDEEGSISWPPLSEAYVEQYLNLENRLLYPNNDQPLSRKRTHCNSIAGLQNKKDCSIVKNIEYGSKESALTLNNTEQQNNLDNDNTITTKNVTVEKETLNSTEARQQIDVVEDAIGDNITVQTAILNCEQSQQTVEDGNVSGSLQNDSALGESIKNSTLDETMTDSVMQQSINKEADENGNESGNLQNDSALGESIKNSTLDESMSNSVMQQSINKEADKDGNVSGNLQNDSALGESIKNSTLDVSGTDSVMHQSINNDATNVTDSILEATNNIAENTTQNDSTLGGSLTESVLETSIIEESESCVILKVVVNSNEDQILNSTSDVSASEQNDSALESNLLSSMNTTKESTTIDQQKDNSTEQINLVSNDSTTNIVESNNCSEGYFSQEFQLENNSTSNNVEPHRNEQSKINLNLPENGKMNHDDVQFKFNEIKIHLPHLDDEGVFFSDLDEHEQRMLSPSVMAMDILPSIPNKSNLTIIVDEDIRTMLNIQDDEPETYLLPVQKLQSPEPIKLNIMKFHIKFLKRRALFKLGPEFDLYIQARVRKRGSTAPEPKQYREPKKIKFYNMNDTNMIGVHVSPANSPGHESEFYGFSDSEYEDSEFMGFVENENTQIDDVLNYHRLSRDSGVDVPITLARSSLEAITEEITTETNNCTRNINENAEKETTNITDGNSNETENAKIVDNSPKPLNENADEGQQTTSTVERNLNENGEVNAEDSNCLNDFTSNTEKEKQTLIVGVENSDEDNTTEPQSSANVAAISNDISSSTEQNVEQLQTTDLNTEIPCSQNLEDITEESCQADANVLFDGNGKSCNVADGLLHKHKDMDIIADLDLDINSSKTKIQKWHEHLQPILAKSRERHHFDVFQLGTEIIDEFAESNDCDSTIGKAITFEDVMENKDASYVSRYFLSSLLLANQSNIKISVNNKTSEQPSAWEDIKFELLSTQRHTVSIEDNIGMMVVASTSKAATKLKNKTKSKTNQPVQLNIAPTIAATPADASVVAENVNVNVNLDAIKPFKQIQKLPSNGDDYDSGIFSSEELM